MNRNSTGHSLSAVNRMLLKGVVLTLSLTLMLLSCTLDSSSPYKTNMSPRIYSIEFTPADTLEVNDTLNITCNAGDPEGDELTYTWQASTGWFDTTLESGSQARWIADLNTGTTTIMISVADRWHSVDAIDSVMVLPVGGLNYPPVILGITPAQDSVEVSDTLSIVCYVDDPDDPVESLLVEWFAEQGELLVTSGVHTNWVAPAATGLFKVRIEVSDSFATTYGDIDIRVVPTGFVNDPPVITSLTADPDEIPAGDTTRITCMATDPELDPLDYSWRVGSGYFIGSGSQVQWVSPGEPGDYKVYVDVFDGNSTVTDSVTISVLPEQNILIQRDFSTDQVSGEWLYIGKLKDLGSDDGPHPISWDEVNQAMSVVGRADYVTFGFQLQNYTFDDGTFKIQGLGLNTQLGRVGFLPKFIDTDNWFMVSVNIYQQSWQVIRCVDGIVQYLAEGWNEYVPDQYYTFTYQKTDNQIEVKIDEEVVWSGIASDELNDAIPLGVAVYGLPDSEPALFDNLIVTDP